MRSQNTKSKGERRISTRRNSLNYFENRARSFSDFIALFRFSFRNKNSHCPGFAIYIMLYMLAFAHLLARFNFVLVKMSSSYIWW